jgi:uncharacterized protein YeaO (DUF488 family)
MIKILVKRVYEPVESSDGSRILVDRLWPRGISKDKVDLWLKEVAPSHELRRRFHGKPRDWSGFLVAYAKELQQPTPQTAIAELRKWLRQGRVTLLYAARDENHNNALALKLWLEGPRK